MNNDLISRNALFKTWDALDETQDPNLLVDAMIKATQEAPAIDAEVVRHGYWEADVWFFEEKRAIKTVPITKENLQKYAFRRPFDIYLTNERCSVCKGSPLANFSEEYELSEYCPHCGARMDGDEHAAD